ncbi:Vacuolar protein sorting-associated protein 9A [Acorus calamus]|uniref:Vacuolar protein sorting-associated protein 9A n=1 Tax=Acorus calamus TaxID=4465 RepID=A0AAV9CKU4_ACOCL|nr:Vacuolar protein sorting-associated protein 9A [Acorus calamus]
MCSASHASSPTTFYGFLHRMRHPAAIDIVRSIKRLLVLIVCFFGGLEKYVMTKLFNRTFACSLEDAKFDQEISEKIYLLQHFIKPEHLDVPEIFHNEASWLIAEKELQRINAYKSPCEKLCCIFNCCKVINNLLINASMSSDHVPAGADEFLPVIIYVTIKASSHR